MENGVEFHTDKYKCAKCGFGEYRESKVRVLAPGNELGLAAEAITTIRCAKCRDETSYSADSVFFDSEWRGYVEWVNSVKTFDNRVQAEFAASAMAAEEDASDRGDRRVRISRIVLLTTGVIMIALYLLARR